MYGCLTFKTIHGSQDIASFGLSSEHEKNLPKDMWNSVN